MRSRREQTIRGKSKCVRSGEEEGVAKKRERITGKKKRKSAKISRRTRRDFGVTGLVNVWR